MLRARTAQVAETQKIEASDMEEEAKALARYQLVLKEVRRARARALRPAIGMRAEWTYSTGSRELRRFGPDDGYPPGGPGPGPRPVPRVLPRAGLPGLPCRRPTAAGNAAAGQALGCGKL